MLGNLILEMTNAPGTAADCLLLGPTTGRLPFSFAFASGSQCFYVLADGTQSEWGIGTYTAGSPNKLTRTTVLKNSAGSTARLNFLGTTRVYNDVPAERFLWIDNNGNVAVANAVIQSAGLQVYKSGGVAISLNDPASASDAKLWDFAVSAGVLYGRAANDLYNNATPWLSVTRSGYAIATITLAGANIALNGAVSTGALSVTGAVSATGSIASSDAITAGTALRLSLGAYLSMDANWSQWVMDTASWRWQYQRSSGRMSYVRGADNAELFVIDGNGNASTPNNGFSANGNITANGKLMCAPGTAGISPNSAGSFLTLSGNTDFTTGANLLINSPGRVPYAFEWYWGPAQIATMDPSGNTRLGGSLIVSTSGAGDNFRLFGDGGGRVMQFSTDGWKLAWSATDGTLAFWNNSGQALVWSDGGGNFNARGAITQGVTSDIRTKRAIQPYSRGLADLIRLRPISYEWNGLGGTNDDGKRRYGLIAQEAETLVPECVYFSPRAPVDPSLANPPPDERLRDQLSLDDAPLRFAVLNALRELAEQNTALAARVATLEART